MGGIGWTTKCLHCKCRDCDGDRDWHCKVGCKWLEIQIILGNLGLFGDGDK